MTSLLNDNDENEIPFDDGEYEYAGDDDDVDNDINNAQVEMFDDDDDDDDDEDSDDEEQMVQNNSAEKNRSRASYTDEMNLIDYVIEEEKEIGGAKGEDSNSTSR
ncbi:unnamed protein product [Rotaria sp. Silwood1]|nr:unnamed protein product [Rotaria sp. Silwood1]CAF4997929.1 unnamed protein product [Rotaria sp. Silwood1]